MRRFISKLLSSAEIRKSDCTSQETSAVIEPKEITTIREIINISLAPIEKRILSKARRLRFALILLLSWLYEAYYSKKLRENSVRALLTFSLLNPVNRNKIQLIAKIYILRPKGVGFYEYTLSQPHFNRQFS